MLNYPPRLAHQPSTQPARQDCQKVFPENSTFCWDLGGEEMQILEKVAVLTECCAKQASRLAQQLSTQPAHQDFNKAFPENSIFLLAPGG